MGSKRNHSNLKLALKAREKHAEKTKAQKKRIDEQTKQAKLNRQLKSAQKIMYAETEMILLVGEGNFSFARALTLAPFNCGQGLFASCYDDKESLCVKYEDAKANVKHLKSVGAEVLVGIDARKLGDVREGAWDGAFDKVVF